MYEAIGFSDRFKTRAMVVIAVLVLVVVALVSMLQPVPSTDANSSGVHAMSAGGRSFAEDSYIERHAELVAANQQVGAR